MSTLLYSAAMSLDGFIAGPGGDASWMVPYLGPNPLLAELTPKIGALLVGGRTFRGDDPYADDPERAGKPFGGEWSGHQVVLTRTPPATAPPDVTFATDLDGAVQAARAAADGKYVNVLGASVARQCLQAGLLEEIVVCIAPVLLGDGTRLLDWPGGAGVKLERVSQSSTPEVTNLWLRVLR